MASHAPPLKNRSRTRILLIVILLLLFAPGIVQAIRIAIIANRLVEHTRSLQRIAEAGAFQVMESSRSREIDETLVKMGQDARELRAAGGALVDWAPTLGWLPRYGGDLGQAPALLEFAEQAAAAGHDTLAIMQSLNDAIEGGIAERVPVSVSLLHASEAQAPQIEATRRKLAELGQVRTRIDVGVLSPSVQAMMNRLDMWLPLWQAGLDGLALAPTFLGADRPRVYLLLAQNSDELRATGGFISGVAELRVDRGEISVTDFQDSYAILNEWQAHPAPPPPLAKYIYAWRWLFRDANWSPDFPTSARMAEDLYRIDQGVTADGVIAVDLQMVPQLLQAVGPVDLGSDGGRVDAANVLARMQEFWASASPGIEQTDERWKHRKDFMGWLLNGLVAHLKSGDFDRTQLGRALYDSILAKDLLIFVNDADAQSDSDFLWSGALFKGGGDALMIVDSNVGFNKVGPSIEREAYYTVVLNSSGDLRASLTMTYTNLSPATGAPCVHGPLFPPTYVEQQQGCYWNYVRVLTPRGSQLVSTSGLLDAGQSPPEQGRAVFSGVFVLPRGGTQVIRLEYRLLPNVKGESDYRLRVEKQPGTPSFPLVAQVVQPDGSHLEFAFSLDRDRELQVTWNRANSAELLGVGFGLGLIVVAGVAMYRRLRPAA